MNAKRILTLMIGMLIMLACMSTAGIEEVGTAAPAVPAPSITGSQPPEPTEDPAGAVFEIPYTWAEPQGLHLCAIVTASQSLHLRSEPSEHAQVLEWLLAGEQVTVIDITAEWWKVKTIGGLEGWARAKYLAEEKCQ